MQAWTPSRFRTASAAYLFSAAIHSTMALCSESDKKAAPVRIGQNAGAQRFGENQNIALLDGIIAQDAVGWTTPETHSPYLGMSSLMVWPPTTMASASATLS